MWRFDSSWRRLILTAAFWGSIGSLAVLGAERDSSFRAALESIKCEELKGHVDYLADDALEGREAGSQGGREAGEYLAAKLEALGLPGAGVDGGFFQPFEPGFRNVLGLVKGGDPDLNKEYVVVGAHYDHLGYGTKQNSRGAAGQIHNGADDNASGTSALLELAEALTLLAQPPRRSILLALWDAEEKGMLGSKHWVAHPTLPLEHVVVLLNADMVGRLRDERLLAFGTRSGYGWRRLVSRGNEDIRLRLEFPWDLHGNGDHWPFFHRGIPVLMLHTDLHDDYHRPTDDAQLINVEGMRRVGQLLFTITYDLANDEAVPKYREAARQEKEATRRGLFDQKPELPERLGVQWEREPPPERGVCLTRVAVGSPAEKAGLEAGDRIIEFAGRVIQTSDEFTWAVTSAENPVSIVVERPGHDGPLELTGQLDGSPMRLGITWRPDDAEPGTLILTQVVPASPAARAGLNPGDSVYQIGGRDFADEAEFAELAKTLPDPLTLRVERDGQLRTVELHLSAQPLKRAA